VVADEETGLLVPARDPAALAAAVLRLWTQPAQGAGMGAAGRRRVEQHFDIRRMVAEYEAMYLA
jgi:glycosyltransferase involved in cell wall biosynthesis